LTSIILAIALCQTKKVLCCKGSSSDTENDDEDEGKEMLHVPLNAQRGVTGNRVPMTTTNRGIPHVQSVSAEEPEEWQDEREFEDMERKEQESIYNTILTQQLGRIGITNQKGGDGKPTSSASGVTIN
jgi:hypothetical protein